MNETLQLSERQQAVLRRVVEEFVGTGEPVGSKTLVARSDLRVSPSTVRSELAELENLGLLTHPHTSAGRVPTERGYRYYADELLGRLEPHPAAFPLDLTSTSTEVESALQATTEMLSQVTRLLALVSAPPLEATHVRHVEVLLLQPQLVMVVVITSAGGVSKRLFHFEELVGACYGLVHRALGAVSLVGPVRMDYEKALGAVRSAALELSRFVESIYDEA